MKMKVGDIVICVDVDNEKTLTLGKSYVILQTLFDNNGIIFHYNPSSYAQGDIYITIPYKELKPILKPHSIINRLMTP